ncbi:PTS sugar transporter subunit IIB [Anaerostipes sp.]|uniref:PTS sugar transporter subunit IIB n=1 Tax=Anaerostipes sp. TaxID=1872530 RepID=UPI0025BC445B|nr:PTS sugar transporter subunit IIB [Anaerostipes sp.]MBS7009596.1 PTS sugar transporter subunit IIB [Anaerostipes sp.]
MNRPVKVIVACGSGIATSTVAANNIQEIFDELGVSVQITKCSMSELSSYSDGMDIIFVTNNYRDEMHCPVINVTSFITGIQKDKTVNKIKDTILTIQKN